MLTLWILIVEIDSAVEGVWRASTVKIIDLKTKKSTDTISTGGKFRVDEMACDPKAHVVIVANNADEPPFLTLISSKPGHKVMAKIAIEDATDGIEQPVYNAATKRFYVSIPELKKDKVKGAVAVINPASGKLEKLLPVNDCRPNGLVQGPGANLLLGCDAGGKDTGLPPVFVVMKTDGSVVKVIPGLGSADMVTYNPKLNTLRTPCWISAFAEAWPDVEFVQEVLALLPWGHNLVPLDKLSAPETLEPADSADKNNFQKDIKKPACGRLLGDGFGLFLVSLTRLQNGHPDTQVRLWDTTQLYRAASWAIWPAASRTLPKCAAQDTDICDRSPAKTTRQSCRFQTRRDLSPIWTAPAAVACSASTTRTPNPVSGWSARRSAPR